MLSISRLHLVNLVKFLLQVNCIFFTRVMYLSIYQVASLPNTFKYWASIWVDCGLGFCMLRHIRCFCRFSVLNVSFGNFFLFCCSKHVCIASFTCNLAPPPALQFSSEFITEIDIKRTDSRGLTLGSSLPPFITPSIEITLQSCSSQITEWWGNKRWDWSKALDDYGPDPVTSLQCPDAVSPPAALTVIKQSLWWTTVTPAFTGVAETLGVCVWSFPF